ncbi:ATP-binding protein [Hydrogenimonas thermophila]|uniref:ATPase n=1 Tax=Hydrogenimonas thermophila TaxID=223786 RepID=A0A1I5UYY0_9BACT|nr:ATP-binding protein [Hydrogenimonas thermophila]SFQ00429.1 hypothetical protein SAMN05216234_1772 [Hydrogenimonas thermophila]
MEQLEALYESTPKALNFIERKISISNKHINIYGPPKSGKTWLVLDYLTNIPKKKHIYIDLNDVRLDKSSLNKKLQDFIVINDIDVVAIDHYDDSIGLPKCKQLIVISQKPLFLSTLSSLLLQPLDFEEYLAFEKRHIHLEHSFSLYLRTGSLPEMATVHETLLTKNLHQIMRTTFPEQSEQNFFRTLAKFLGKPLTANQLYTTLKKEHKFSKDRVYKTIKEWEDRQIIKWVKKFNQPKAAKRLLLYDFALPASMYFEKSLMGQLYSIAANKMLQNYPDVSYTETMDLYEPTTNQAILLSPFANPQSSAAKVSKLINEIETLKIKSITILTIANSFDFEFEKINVNAKPFYEWIIEE